MLASPFPQNLPWPDVRPTVPEFSAIREMRHDVTTNAVTDAALLTSS